MNLAIVWGTLPEKKVMELHNFSWNKFTEHVHGTIPPRKSVLEITELHVKCHGTSWKMSRNLMLISHGSHAVTEHVPYAIFYGSVYHILSKSKDPPFSRHWYNYHHKSHEYREQPHLELLTSNSFVRVTSGFCNHGTPEVVPGQEFRRLSSAQIYLIKKIISSYADDRKDYKPLWLSGDWGGGGTQPLANPSINT